jgi:hypothetical protein
MPALLERLALVASLALASPLFAAGPDCPGQVTFGEGSDTIVSR